ncbi:MAG TPA: LysR substrate-binding domain-containing protein, partial [Propionibacteriaceae bacterium]
TERRFVALPAGHALADRQWVDFGDLIGEPFLRLPASSGVMADFWLALDQRGGQAPVIGGEVTTTEETVEAVSSGAGVVLVAEGNVPLVARNGIIALPVPYLPPAVLVLAWRRADRRPLVDTFRACVQAAIASTPTVPQPTL